MSIQVIHWNFDFVAIILDVSRCTHDVDYLVHLCRRKLVDLGNERLLLLQSERVVRIFAVIALAAEPSEGKVAYM